MPHLDKLPWDQVEDSSNVHSLYWDDKSQTICVKFNNGGIYSYMGAPETVYLDLRHADSVGKYLNAVVKAYPYTRWETEDALLSHLNVPVVPKDDCVRCGEEFQPKVPGQRVCDPCWFDDPT